MLRLECEEKVERVQRRWERAHRIERGGEMEEDGEVVENGDSEADSEMDVEDDHAHKEVPFTDNDEDGRC